MNELIVVKRQVIGNETVNAVDARELHTFLESKQEFAHWIKGRIEKYDFAEDIDFIIFSHYVNSESRPRKDANLTIQSALTIIQGENSVKGNEAKKIISKSVELYHTVMEALRDFEVPDDLPDMYVYAIREIETGRIKIGISKCPSERLHQLQVANPNRLELVECVKAKNRFNDEKSQHRLNSDHRIRGEWYEQGAMLHKEVL